MRTGPRTKRLQLMFRLRHVRVPMPCHRQLCILALRPHTRTHIHARTRAGARTHPRTRSRTRTHAPTHARVGRTCSRTRPSCGCGPSHPRRSGRTACAPNGPPAPRKIRESFRVSSAEGSRKFRERGRRWTPLRFGLHRRALRLAVGGCPSDAHGCISEGCADSAGMARACACVRACLCA
jgi:hypothetical protein